MWSPGVFSRRWLAPVGVAVAIATGGIGYGVARADVPDSGVINGCYNSTTGILRVIDTSAHQSCHPDETALSWNQMGPRGPVGPQGPPGPTGPAGPAGTITALDQLNGIPCDGINSRPASVRVTYGTGIEAPVALTCVTHLVANPGTFAFRVASGTLSTSLIADLPLPINGWALSGQIDSGGVVTIPSPGINLSSVPFDKTASIGGFSNVHTTGSISFTANGLSGSLDPSTGAANLSGGVYATVTITATTDVSGQTTKIYSGTCSFGSAAVPIPITLTTASPGVPYSQTTGALTLSTAFTAPSLDSCNPAIPTIYGFLLEIFAGTDRLTLTGATNPIITAA